MEEQDLEQDTTQEETQAPTDEPENKAKLTAGVSPIVSEDTQSNLFMADDISFDPLIL